MSSRTTRNMTAEKTGTRKSTRIRKPVKTFDTSSDSEEEAPKDLVKKTSVVKTPTKQKNGYKQCEYDMLSPVTPPKQKKIQNKTPGTPSSLLQNLSIISPDKSKSTSKKTLFTQETEENHLKNHKKAPSSYQNARRALHSSYPTSMPGREKEIAELKEFIERHLANDSSGSIYVSGPPGTGKTASLNLILQDDKVATRVQHIYINCTAIKSATSVYSRINKELGLKVSGRSEKEHLSSFEKYLNNKKHNHKTILLVLDEIDQLESKNHEILYTIFEWPSRPNSRLILIGIANALDLTDRTLPRLQARCELKPKLLHFAPYSKEQIVQIFTSRLESAGVLEVFSPVALQMLAGKVASVSGDVRRALDIGRRVVELIDQNRASNVLKSVENFTKQLEAEEPPKQVDLKEVVKVLNNVYSTTQNLLSDDALEETFPLQQKIVICTLLLMLKKAKNKDVTIGKLHEVYSKVCTKRNLMAVDQAEFVGLCSLIETRGIIRVNGKKEPRLYKVSLEWNETEVGEALKDKQLMSTILQDESCLGRL